MLMILSLRRVSDMGTLFTSTLPLGVIVITGPPPHEPSLRRTSVKYSPTIASSGDQVNHKRVCAINPRAILHEGFILKYQLLGVKDAQQVWYVTRLIKLKMGR